MDVLESKGRMMDEVRRQGRQPTLPDSRHGVGSGLCECGCGRQAPIAPKTVRSAGYVKGEPMRFCAGHRAGPRGRKRIHPLPERGPNPEGFCLCGCGLLAPIADYDNAQTGVLKGHPVRYCLGHATNLRKGRIRARMRAGLEGPEAWPGG